MIKGDEALRRGEARGSPKEALRGPWGEERPAEEA